MSPREMGDTLVFEDCPLKMTLTSPAATTWKVCKDNKYQAPQNCLRRWLHLQGFNHPSSRLILPVTPSK